jgi:hypothetical protein
VSRRIVSIRKKSFSLTAGLKSSISCKRCTVFLSKWALMPSPAKTAAKAKGYSEDKKARRLAYATPQHCQSFTAFRYGFRTDPTLFRA